LVIREHTDSLDGEDGGIWRYNPASSESATELSGTSTTAILPTSRAPIFVRLWKVFDSSLEYKDYTYTESPQQLPQ
jgi:hypothetical protein